MACAMSAAQRRRSEKNAFRSSKDCCDIYYLDCMRIRLNRTVEMCGKSLPVHVHCTHTHTSIAMVSLPFEGKAPLLSLFFRLFPVHLGSHFVLSISFTLSPIDASDYTVFPLPFVPRSFSSALHVPLNHGEVQFHNFHCQSCASFSACSTFRPTGRIKPVPASSANSMHIMAATVVFVCDAIRLMGCNAFGNFIIRLHPVRRRCTFIALGVHATSHYCHQEIE